MLLLCLGHVWLLLCSGHVWHGANPQLFYCLLEKLFKKPFLWQQTESRESCLMNCWIPNVSLESGC